MAEAKKNTLAEKSLAARVKNFGLNFAIAIVWLIKSIYKYIKRGK